MGIRRVRNRPEVRTSAITPAISPGLNSEIPLGFSTCHLAITGLVRVRLNDRRRCGLATTPDAIVYIPTTKEVWVTTGAPPLTAGRQKKRGTLIRKNRRFLSHSLLTS